jgi:hypothetical protein
MLKKTRPQPEGDRFMGHKPEPHLLKPNPIGFQQTMFQTTKENIMNLKKMYVALAIAALLSFETVSMRSAKPHPLSCANQPEVGAVVGYVEGGTLSSTANGAAIGGALAGGAGVIFGAVLGAGFFGVGAFVGAATGAAIGTVAGAA